MARETIKLEVVLEEDDLEELVGCQDISEFMETDRGADIATVLENKLEELRKKLMGL